MPDLSIANRFIHSLVGAALLLPLGAFAQSAPVYLVELLVFSQPSGATAEQWEALPELRYPTPSRFLIYPGEQPLAPSSVGAATSGGALPAMNTLPAPMQPALFTTLPPEQQQLATKAAAMSRSGRYRILFHDAWLQPISSQAESVPIVLDRSGDGGAWPALQGSIKLYLDTYVYLQTNLWLNTRGEYLPGVWRMPAPPLAPASHAAISALPATAKPVGQSVGAGAQKPPMDTQVGKSTLGMGDTPGPEYPFRHAVLLQQTRRIPSGKIAYVDHPLLGVLVQVSPLEPSLPAAGPAPSPATSPATAPATPIAQ
jgi:Peptidoglycan-binding protein, CsiV